MPVKIRLQRHGKKGYAFFHIVIADGRAPRDGKFIEKLGTYNPNTNPATIELDHEKALQWLKNGAQPTDTARAILSYRGVMMKLHLDKGVAKGAHSQEEADAKFEKWLADKNTRIEGKVSKLAESRSDFHKRRLEEETAKNEARAAAIAAKNSPVAEEVEANAEAEEAVAEAPAEEVVAEVAAPEAKAEEPAPEAKAEVAAPEAKAEEAAPETKAEEATPEAKAEEAAPEAKAEEPAPEAKAEEPAPEAKAEEPAPEAKAEEPAPEAKAEEPAPEAKAEEPAPEAKAEDNEEPKSEA